MPFMPTLRPVVLGLAILAIATGEGTRAFEPPQSGRIAELLDRYVRRDAGVLAALGEVGDLNAARVELERLGPKFLDGEPLEVRRRWLVAFALDLAQANSELQSVPAGAIVEWACRHVRRHDPPDEFDYRWQLAATSLLAGAINPAQLEGHLRHIAEQFPDEPRFALAHALAAEQRTAPREVLARARTVATQPTSTRTTAPTEEWFREEAGRRYQALALSMESLRAEAHVRRAHVHIELGRFDDALAVLKQVEPLTKDPVLIYLGRLFRGLAHEGLNDQNAARAAYRSALEVSAGAHSATMALATSLFRGGQRDEAARVVESLLRKNDPRLDPWWAYWAGDYRFWVPLMNGVRGMLQ